MVARQIDAGTTVVLSCRGWLMTRSAKKPSQAGAERLEEIKTTAAKWFFRRGYEGTDLRRIAADIDIHPSSFYNYVSSKEELLYLVMKDGMNEILAGADAAVAESATSLQRLRSLICFHTIHHLRRRHSAWTSYVEFRALTGKYRAEILIMRKQYEAMWIAVLQAGIAEGVFRSLDPHVTAYTMIATAQGMSQWFNPRGRMSAQQIAEQNATLLTQGVILGESAAGVFPSNGLDSSATAIYPCGVDGQRSGSPQPAHRSAR